MADNDSRQYQNKIIRYIPRQMFSERFVIRANVKILTTTPDGTPIFHDTGKFDKMIMDVSPSSSLISYGCDCIYLPYMLQCAGYIYMLTKVRAHNDLTKLITP